ncbi:MAG: hypothetical protein KIS66_04525 [Fimbriimonadaceae bacterium]|nr:hypothetical protein [Fimbriimonadaceae bacterium]
MNADPSPDARRTPTGFPYRRVLVYGVTGSGKTTAARRLSEVTGLPWTEVDTLTWEPGWVEVPIEVQRARIAEICAGEAWILDSAYGKWLDIPLERAELIVGLDYSRSLSLFRVIWRTVTRAITGELVCNGNVESFRNLCSRDSLVVWHFRSFGRKRERIRRWQADPGGFVVLAFRRPSEFDRWLRELSPVPRLSF